jgi:pSer/pThr/pTyr-binding forkhead associated (FHA) protein
VHVCSRCGKENQDHYKFCLGCGGEIGDSPPRPKAAPQSVPISLADDDPDTSMNQPAVPVSDTDPGALEMPPRTASTHDTDPSSASGGGMRPCQTCGNSVPVSFVFCGQCGSRVDAAPAVATPTTPQTTTAGARGKLVLIRPDGTEGGSHSLAAGSNIIGRGQGALFDADSYLSPRHAELTITSDGALVRDSDSLNGVFVKLTEEEEIQDGEVFRIGQELLRFDIIHSAVPLEDGTEVMGSPNPGYWGRVALIVGKDQDGSAFPLFGDAVILGRERGDILFPEDGYVSGTHARLSYRGGRYFLADLNSSNGSFIRIRGERVVASGTFLLMGQQLFRVQLG